MLCCLVGVARGEVEFGLVVQMCEELIVVIQCCTYMKYHSEVLKRVCTRYAVSACV